MLTVLPAATPASDSLGHALALVGLVLLGMLVLLWAMAKLEPRAPGTREAAPRRPDVRP